MNTPYTIQVIMHYYLAVNSTPDYQDSNAFRDTSFQLLKKGILVNSKSDRKFDANKEACEVYINALCEVKLPISRWVIP